MAKETPVPVYDSGLDIVIVPGKTQTVKSLVTLLKRRQTKDDTAYKIAKATGLTINAVKRFFQGYKGLSRVERDAVGNTSDVGRVRLETFLQIVQAMGYDVEIVAREQPGREEL